jgi:hypothetical protein
MSATKITTGYTVDPRSANGRRMYAVMRQYTYRGKPGEQLVTIYTDEATADSVRAALDLNKRREA